jgi:hypothetical protein
MWQEVVVFIPVKLLHHCLPRKCTCLSLSYSAFKTQGFGNLCLNMMLPPTLISYRADMLMIFAASQKF